MTHTLGWVETLAGALGRLGISKMWMRFFLWSQAPWAASGEGRGGKGLWVPALPGLGFRKGV